MSIVRPSVLSFLFLFQGQRFVGDLLPDGKIKSQETDIVFASPSAWAIHCKRIINPEKKSGCGWASVGSILILTCRYEQLRIL
jgi:hypothetical protein